MVFFRGWPRTIQVCIGTGIISSSPLSINLPRRDWCLLGTSHRVPVILCPAAVTGSSHLKPKWSQSVFTLHRACKTKYRVWIASGHSFDLADPYKTAKAAFRRAHRAYQRNSLATFYDSLDSSSRDVFRTIRSYFALPTSHLILEGPKYSGPDIIYGWEKYFANLSSSTNSIRDTSNIDQLVSVFLSTPHDPSDTLSWRDRRDYPSPA